jgi:DNA-directed RNA polymerase specialized sigma24 family protein
VLSYRVVEGMSVAEVAQRMAVSEDEVKALQYRALTYAASLRAAAE